MRTILLLASIILLVKAAQFGLGYWSNSRIPAERHSRYVVKGIPMFAWDSLRYRDILTRGYPEPGNEVPADIAFFPLYPLTAAALPFLRPEFSLLIVANIASIVGLLVFYGWAYRSQGASAARWAVILAVAYPPAMFLSAAYTEGMFLLFTALTCRYLQKNQSLPAALSSGLACLTRPTGVALAGLVLAWELTRSPGEWSARRVARILLIGVVSVSGLIVYEGYLTAKYGRWDVYFAAQAEWEKDDAPVAAQGSQTVSAEGNRHPSEAPRPAIHRLLAKAVSVGAWNKLFAWGFLLLTIAGFFLSPKNLRFLFALPLLIFLLGFVPGWGSRIGSIARFETAAIPVFLPVASWVARCRRPALWWPIVSMAGILQFWYVWEFNVGNWCG